MSGATLIRRTGQWWKLQVAFGMLLVGGASMFFGLRNLERQPWWIPAVLVLGGIVVVFGSLVFGCIAVRCPKCRAPWIWMAVKGQESGQWLQWLLSLSKCPRCGFSNTAADQLVGRSA